MIKRFLMLAVVVAALVTCMSMESDPNATEVSEFSDYADWSVVNSETITGDTTGALGRVHQGPSGFREVYINTTGKAVSDGQSDFPYPVGTVVVKESYNRKDGVKNDLKDLTIMVKRKPGYDTENGDWEYLLVSPALRIKSQGRIGMCIDCHTAAAADDYIFTNNR